MCCDAAMQRRIKGKGLMFNLENAERGSGVFVMIILLTRSSCPLRGKVFLQNKLDWDDHFYPMMTHFDPAGSGLFQHDRVRFYRAHGVSG